MIRAEALREDLVAEPGFRFRLAETPRTVQNRTEDSTRRARSPVRVSQGPIKGSERSARQRLGLVESSDLGDDFGQIDLSRGDP